MAALTGAADETMRLDAELDVETVLDHLGAPTVISRLEHGSERPLIVYVNPAAAEQLGYERHELVGRGPEVWQGPDMDLADIIEIGRRLRGGERVEIRRQVARKDGRAISVDLTLDPILAPSAVYVIEVAREVASPAAEGELRFADVVMDLSARRVWRRNRLIPLTPTESSLLELFLRRPGEILPRARLMKDVWGYDPGPTSRAAHVYVGYLRHKLESGGAPRLIHTVRGRGYVLREP